MTILYNVLWNELTRTQKSSSSFIHGVNHWKRVLKNGLIIARETGANFAFIELFALFHDSCRLNDGKDPDHGKRAAEFILSRRSDLNGFPDELFGDLLEALRNHTHVKYTSSIHIAACWDADRLDLGRVGITPSEKYMNTEIGRVMAKKVKIPD